MFYQRNFSKIRNWSIAAALLLGILALVVVFGGLRNVSAQNGFPIQLWYPVSIQAYRDGFAVTARTSMDPYFGSTAIFSDRVERFRTEDLFFGWNAEREWALTLNGEGEFWKDYFGLNLRGYFAQHSTLTDRNVIVDPVGIMYLTETDATGDTSLYIYNINQDTVNVYENAAHLGSYNGLVAIGNLTTQSIITIDMLNSEQLEGNLDLYATRVYNDDGEIIQLKYPQQSGEFVVGKGWGSSMSDERFFVAEDGDVRELQLVPTPSFSAFDYADQGFAVNGNTVAIIVGPSIYTLDLTVDEQVWQEVTAEMLPL